MIFDGGREKTLFDFAVYCLSLSQLPRQREPLDALLLLPVETQGFHLIRPVRTLGTFPSRGRLDSSREAFDEEKQKDSRPVGGYPYFMAL